MRFQQARRRSVAFAFTGLAFRTVLLLLCGLCSSAAEPARKLRPFTVEDSIELSYFANPVLWTVNQEPPAEPVFSPDGKHILVVTQRGILESNKIEASIWVFERPALEALLANKLPHPPAPTRIVSWRATSNAPVMSDVRWLEDSRHIAFLGRDDHGLTQLYTVDTVTKAVHGLTHSVQPVSAYDIVGNTIAYTTLDHVAEDVPENGDDFVDVTGQTIWSLIWRGRPSRERDESWLLSVPNTLHVMKQGREVNSNFRFEGRPLKLFFPTLSLSPDKKSLITVAPVVNVPPMWKSYEARSGYADLVLVPGDKMAAEPENNWKASQFVKIDLAAGTVQPLIAAPAGRALFQLFAPTKVIWSPDSNRVLLSNTFLPLTGNDATDAIRKASPAAVTVNISSHQPDSVTYFPQPSPGNSNVQHVSDIIWNTHTNTVEVLFASSPDNVPIESHETYRWQHSGWERFDAPCHKALTVSVHQDLNRAPVLSGNMNGEDGVTIWDPNPQLSRIALGSASLYTWKDRHGLSRSGILVLPPDYMPGHRYPLVIQTHGFEPKKFFADGIYTTGSGGRALCGRGMILLQTEQYSKSGDYQRDAEIEVEAFRSAIEKLTHEGLVDSRRVGIIGFSFTVYHVLYAITHYPDLFAAATITDGNDLSYWLYLLWTDIPLAQKMAENANGGVKPFGREGLARWQETAPGFNLDRVKAPLLISCFETGTLVATWDIYGGLRTLKKPVELVWLRNEDAPHVLVQPRQRYFSQESAVDWFDYWLNGHEETKKEKVERYARWGALRKMRDNERRQSEAMDKSR
jgi:dipeptidyl aminopeptidase/acylaminoacyl peptidase